MKGRVISAVAFATLSLCLSGVVNVGAQNKRPVKHGSPTPVLWRHPGHIPSRDLRFGPGSESMAPVPPFRFVKEVRSGESPKFDVKDANGTTWRVKLGVEAQAETVATRLVWAVGYFAEEAYYFDQVQIKDLPRLSRGSDFVLGNGMVTGARFEPQRPEMKSGGTWSWDDNPFRDTQHLSGLKVLMILLNNYDARSLNNEIFIVGPEARYYVTDLGASLGKAGGLGGKRSKNDLEDFRSTRFVIGTDEGVVKFDYDTRPTKLGVFSVLYPPYYMGQVKKERSMRGIPVHHARWIGSLLSQLTEEQLHDAFDAAGYDYATKAGYVQTIRERIGQLTSL